MRHLLRIAGLGMALWLGIVGPRASDSAARASPADEACIPASQCCKICDKGYACGNTCISLKKQCHVGRGCACNASELCG